MQPSPRGQTEQQPLQPVSFQQYNPGQSGQQHNPVQSGQQNNPGQSGQQYNPAQSGQQYKPDDQSGHYYNQGYSQPTPPPNYYYGGHFTGQPPNVTNSPMVRQGSFRRQTEESELAGWTGFIDQTVRTKFIRKVYIILSLQLLFTLGMIALFIYEPHVKQFVHEHIYLYYVALAIFFAVYVALICFQSVRRRFPQNIIVLIIFTISMSFMCATISTFYDTDIVLMAAGICAAVCLVVTIFSFYTKFDFTTCGSILCILMLILILFGIIAIFYPTKVMTMLYAGLGATVFTLMLAYDTQMMMGGKNYELSPEEHVFAAVQIYIDIVYIFLYLLTLIGAGDR